MTLKTKKATENKHRNDDSSIKQLCEDFSSLQVSVKPTVQQPKQQTAAKHTPSKNTANKKCGLFHAGRDVRKLRFSEIPESVISSGPDAVKAYACSQLKLR